MNPHFPYFSDDLPLPYKDCDMVRDMSRLSADISYADKKLIKHICPKKGILNQLTQNLFHSICENLRKNNITYYSPQHEQHLIRLILRGCTAIESFEPPTAGYVHRRVADACSGVTGNIQQHGESQETPDHGKAGSQDNQVEIS